MSKDRVIAIAKAEVGYLEKATNYNLDSKTGNAGSQNWTKYARDLYAAGYYNGNKNGYAWCDVFVDWCFFKAYGSKTKAEAVECQTGTLGAGCEYSLAYYRNAGRFSQTPLVGDQIFFATRSFSKIPPATSAILVLCTPWTAPMCTPLRATPPEPVAWSAMAAAWP